MDTYLHNSDFSYDPVTALNEEDAKGKTAEIFIDIKETMNIPLITSIWRGLASMEHSLEDVWALTKPIYLSGTPELAFNKMMNSINLPIPKTFNQNKFIQKDMQNIRKIIKVYNKSNGMNLMALSAFIRSDYKPRVNIINTTPKIVKPTFPKLMNKDEISSETWLIVKNVNSIGSPQGIDSHIATLWRHLAHWPEFLSLVYKNFKPLDLNTEIYEALENILSYVKENGINLKRQKIKYSEINDITRNTISDYVHTKNQVIRMVVLGNMMDKWLR
jgi:hypothetical protein